MKAILLALTFMRLYQIVTICTQCQILDTLAEVIIENRKDCGFHKLKDSLETETFLEMLIVLI